MVCCTLSINLRLSIYLFLFLSFSQSVMAQQLSNSSLKSSIERIDMPAVDNESLQEKEMRRRAAGEVPEFAIAHKVTIHPDKHGTWTTDKTTNEAVWQVHIRSKRAKSLNFGFSTYFMPEGGKLYLESIDQKRVRGPFTPADNEVHQELWTPIVFGDEVVIKVQIPKAKRDELRLVLSSVNHDFIGFESLLSQRCHLDVNCGTVDGWEQVEPYRNIIKSVSMYSIRGTRACTGFLVNNTRQDCTPYYMTADHCGISANNAASVVTYWNYENSTCRTPNTSLNGQQGDGQLEQFNTGAQLRASQPNTDMTLLELDDPIVDTTGVYFAGWNRMDETSVGVIGIHHPATEEKRISFSSRTLERGDPGGNSLTDGDFWVVPNWDIGSTEGGSSGSPLFNLGGEVVGQLFGGAAACGNQEYDAYGSFAKSWNTGLAADSRLKDWLDPDDLGINRLAGYWQAGCGNQLSASNYNQNSCIADTARFVITRSEAAIGEEWNWQTIGLPEGVSTQLIVNSPTEAELQIYDLANAVNTSSVFNFVAGEMELLLKLSILPDELMQPILVSPFNGTPTAALRPLLQWEAVALSPTYDLQIATDSLFENMVQEANGIEGNVYSELELEASTRFFWRVRATSKCSISAWSTPASFTTSSCETFSSNDVPINISQGAPNTYRSTLNVSTSGIISDLNIAQLQGTHTWISDLQFDLISPDGTQVNLLNRPCFNERNFDLLLDDESLLTSFNCPLTDGQAYVPEEALANFQGEDRLGEWTLVIRDHEFQDGGRLLKWSIEVCQVSEQFDIDLKIEQDDFLVCGEDRLEIDFQFGADLDTDSLKVAIIGLPNSVRTTISLDTLNRSGRIELSELQQLAVQTYPLSIEIKDKFFYSKLPITIVKRPLPQVQLVSPADGEEDIRVDNIELSWTGVADEYEVQVSETSTFDSFVAQTITNAENWSFPDSLNGDQDYFWRVLAVTDCGTLVSSVRRFQTEIIVSTDPIVEENIELFPNPSTGHVQLKLPSPGYDLTIYNTKGQVVSQQKLDTKVELDLRQQPKGIYYLRFSNQQQVVVRKLVLH